MRLWIWTIAFAAMTVSSAVARADESEVPLSAVPQAGVQAVKAMFPGAEITGAARETEKDTTVYEVSLKQKDRKIDVTVGEDGKIQVVEKEIDYKDLPDAVKRALESKYPQATYKIVEEVSAMKNGKLTLDFYEALLVTGNKETLEVQIAADGKIKAEEKKTERD